MPTAESTAKKITEIESQAAITSSDDDTAAKETSTVAIATSSEHDVVMTSSPSSDGTSTKIPSPTPSSGGTVAIATTLDSSAPGATSPTSGAAGVKKSRGGSGSQKMVVQVPNPLPSYITKVDKPPPRVLKESLHCTTCNIYVNSDSQMKQHINSLRHKNTVEGIPTTPKPGREEKTKPKAAQYRCSVCKIVLNSDIQLVQHLNSGRHNFHLELNMKRRQTPYERNLAAIQRSIPMVAKSNLVLLPHALPNGTAMTDLIGSQHHQLIQQQQQQQTTRAQALAKTPIMVADQSAMLQRGIVYISAAPQQTTFAHHHPSGTLQAMPGLLNHQAGQIQLSNMYGSAQTIMAGGPTGLSLIPQLPLSTS